MYRCVSWAIKKAEHQRTDAFKLWCWKRHLRVPWTARRSSQSILKEISPEYSLEGLMLKLQYFGPLDSRILLFPDSLLNQTWWYVQRGNSHKHLSLLHLRVPNPDIDSCWCSLVTVMDLCSAFFPPLIPDSPFLSAIMFRGRQSTWTHVSQELCEIIFPSL